MRELLFRNLTTQGAHRRDLFISEVVTQGDTVIKTQRRSVYFIKDCVQVDSPSNPVQLKRLNEDAETKKKHFYVIKKHDTTTGEDKLYCKVDGFLYVVLGNYVYLVAYENSFKIDVKKKELSAS